MKYCVRNKYTEQVMYEAEAESFRSFLEATVKKGKSLRYVDLSKADLNCADLSKADLNRADLRLTCLNRTDLRLACLESVNLAGACLWDANLRCADLTDANLIVADLSSANLEKANLSNANLSGAYFNYANLKGANLSGCALYGASLDGARFKGAIINWNSHDLLAQLLLKAAGDDIHKRAIAEINLVSRDWCWNTFMNKEYPCKEWALQELAKWIMPGDGHPRVLDEYV